MLETKASSKANIFSWKTKKISRVCSSFKGAETGSLEDGLDKAIHFARMVQEIFDGFVDLKNPRHIEVEAVTDNKGLWENLYNTHQCEEKMLKEMLNRKEVKSVESVEWVELADALSKRGGKISREKERRNNGYVELQRGYS